ncbi:MAG: HD domain-containing protein [Clostridia bacterium]|nr:HD domain-containing protein [Clostridia bacterium]
MSLKYEKLSSELCERIEYDRAEGWRNPYAARGADALRRNPARDAENLWRPAYVRDIDKIMHSAYYNRYTDKTQVFSFYKNDDITRRALHVQLVSRIARNIGAVLGLNCDLIEAIALGHDMGHTPFGHAGEDFLDRLYYGATGRRFAHNLQSVRVLDGVFPYNISLQTLSGIVSHNGELAQDRYEPAPLGDFAAFDADCEACRQDLSHAARLRPNTLEGCVVRICDMIAYLGKDRQDAERAGLIPPDAPFAGGTLGTRNAEIINNLVVNIIENSYGKDHLSLDAEHFEALRAAKRDNYESIYLTGAVRERIEGAVEPMFEQIYAQVVRDVREGRAESVVHRHHIDFINASPYKRGAVPYGEAEDADTVACDYIASMTDDYMVDLHARLFPKSSLRVEYRGYFDK